MDEILRDAEQRMRAHFAELRAEKKLSKAHDESHVLAVATYGLDTARILSTLARPNNYDNYRVAELTYLAGLLHDYCREAKETEPHGPRSAEYFHSLCGQYPYSQLTDEEAYAVEQAIAEHEKSFNDIEAEFGNPTSVVSIIAHGLLTGDKVMEASGPRVGERRSFFVGKERMHGGDITMFEYPKESDLAVLGETMIRLYGKNPISGYPAWIVPYAEGLHAWQYQWYSGLLGARELTEEIAAQIMLEKGFPKFTPEIAAKIGSEKHISPDGIFGSGPDNPIKSKVMELQDLNPPKRSDLNMSVIALVNLFAMGDSPEQVIETYVSDGELQYLDRFMGEIRDYRTGTEEMRQGLMKSVSDNFYAN